MKLSSVLSLLFSIFRATWVSVTTTWLAVCGWRNRPPL